MLYCRYIQIIILLLSLPVLSKAQEVLTLMSYNLLNYEGLQPDTAIRNPYFRHIMQSVSPDLLVCEEVKSYQGIQGFVSHVMNTDGDKYALGTFITGFDSNKALIYRKEKFSFISNHAINTSLRDINEFKMVHKSSGDTLRLYAVHLKASSGNDEEAQRAAEVDSLRKRTNTLPPATDFIVCGDFNIYSSNEEAYQKLMADNATDDGHVIDPILISGTFNNQAYAKYHTQSPRVRTFGGGVAGGLDDRFDMMLFSNSLMQPGGITYVAGSTVAYGNDGNHYNDSINRLPNAAVDDEMANALHAASDHLPLISQIEFQTTGLASVQTNEVLVSVSPNPFSEQLEFKFKPMPEGQVEFELSDVMGRLIAAEQFRGAATFPYTPPALPPGMYHFRMRGKNFVAGGVLIRN